MRRDAIQFVQTLGPDSGTVFTPLHGEPALIEAGILARPMAELEADWRARLAPTFARFDLSAPGRSTWSTGRLPIGALETAEGPALGTFPKIAPNVVCSCPPLEAYR